MRNCVYMDVVRQVIKTVILSKMVITEIIPSPFLAEYIRLYRIVDFIFPDGAMLPFKIYPPRPEHCLQFYPKDTETVTYPESNFVVSNKKATVIGQHTVVNHRLVGKEFLAFQVVFQPSALYRLTGIASAELTNTYMDAEDIFGNITRLVNEKLYCAKNYTEMVQIIEQFLDGLIKKSNIRQHSIDFISMHMVRQNECYSLDRFIKESCLCHRQFDRKFIERIGVSPKQYLQIIRFDKAFRMKNRFPHLDWLTIALHCGYYDYQHLVKDYKEFTGYTPNQFLESDHKAPERFFDEAEI